MLLAVDLLVLNELVALFVAIVLVAYVSHKLRLVSIAGFLLAGVFIGPSGLGLVNDRELVDVLAEVGVILLLFTIGLEFSLDKLSRIRRAIFVGGGIQVALSTGIVVGLLLFFGVSWQASVYTGCLVALSSTAIVLGLLNERDETDTPAGRLSLAILIFQDLAIVAMVLLVPILAGGDASTLELMWVLTKAVLLIVGVLFLARRLVPWILEHVAHTRRQELFLLTVVTICFGTAAAAGYAGVSLALGAFLAGLVVSESRFSQQAMSEILPLRTIFNAVFFASVGMLFDLRFLFEYPLLVLFAAGGVIVIKFTTTTLSGLILGYPIRIAAAVGLTLAQIGEFSFVLERTGRSAGLVPGDFGDIGAQAFIAATVLLMLITPLQVGTADRLGAFLSRTPLKRLGRLTIEGASPKSVQLEDHVIIVGCGQAGKRLVNVLNDSGIPFVVVEMNSAVVKDLQRRNLPAIYGDAARVHILEVAGVKQAKLCVIVINDPTISPRIIQQVRFLNPTIQIIARTRYLADLTELQEMGADVIVPEEMETTVRIFSHVLGAYMIRPEEVEQHIRILRADQYGVMRGSIQEAHLMVLEGLDDDGMHTRAVAVREGTFADGKSLETLALRRRHSLTVLAVRREGKMIANPAGDFRVLAGDRLVLIGTAQHFADSADLFRKPESSASSHTDSPSLNDNGP